MHHLGTLFRFFKSYSKMAYQFLYKPHNEFSTIISSMGIFTTETHS